MTDSNSKQNASNDMRMLVSNAYWMIANNAIEGIRIKIPSFTRFNPETAHIYEAWDGFIDNPNMATFNAFFYAFMGYGMDSRWN